MRFLIAGTLAGGFVLSILNWFTAAILPPRYKQFSDPRAVAAVVRANAPEDDIYTAPQGLFVAVSLGAHHGPAGPRIATQFAIEFGIALGLSVLLLLAQPRSSVWSAVLLGLAGLLAGIETHFPNWNWAGFPTSYVIAGPVYLAVNWFLTGLVLGAIRKRFERN